MKKLIVYLLSLLPFGATAQTEEPTDPKTLHDYLYKQAVVLVNPYLVVHGVPTKGTKGAKAQADLEKGITLFERVLGLNQHNWAAAWCAGKAAQSLGDQDRAYKYFKLSFEFQKENPDVARELMITCLDTRRAKEAVGVAEHAVRINDADAGLKANLALALLCAGDLARAEESVEAALKQNSTDQISIALKGVIGEVKRGERKQPETPSDLQK